MALAAASTGGAPRPAVAAPGAAANSPKALAKRKLVEGAELLKKRDFQAALERFQAAYELLPSPKIQYNLGLAYMGLGRNADALTAFHTFLSEADDASSETITNARTYKEALVQKIFRLTVRADLDGAAIGIDGRAYGNTPRLDEILLDAGAHALLVEKPGVGKAFSKRFDAAPGGSLTIEAKLLPPKPPRSRLSMEAPHAANGARAAGAARGTGPASVEGNLVRGTAAPAETGTRSGVRAMRLGAYVTGGVALAALGFGALEWVIKEQKFGSFNTHCSHKADVVDMGGGDCTQLYNDGNQAKTLGYVGFAAGGALGVASTVLFVVSRHQGAGGTETALACAPSLTVPGGTCRLRF